MYGIKSFILFCKEKRRDFYKNVLNFGHNFTNLENFKSKSFSKTKFKKYFC